MSGASDATNRLQSLLSEPVAAVATATRTAIVAQNQMRAADDLIPAMAAAANLALALEALSSAAGSAEAACRERLAEIMADTGCTSFHTDGHTIFLRDAPHSVQITDDTLIPPEFMVAPPPRPDRKALAAALKAGPVPGAVLANRPPPVVAFKPRKVAA